MIKHFKKITSVFLFSAALVSCSNDIDESSEKPEQKILGFEDLILKNNSKWVSTEDNPIFTSGIASFKSFVGFGRTSAGYSNIIESEKESPNVSEANGYVVKANSGANGTKNYAVINCAVSPGSNFEVNFSKEIKPVKASLNTSVYAYYAMKDGGEYFQKLQRGQYQRLIIQGIDSHGYLMDKKVIFYFADLRDGKDFILDEWKEVNLSSLGKVNGLSFKMEANVEIGVTYPPSYFCFDELVYQDLNGQ
ncbi:DUF4465 domain-containing protein [Aureibacter tunicatorum]|uniref:DUF4465 domain-containing protein n=1 Tax=Aureibacter tunicatorum TaxID=866807 RepID=A0AAE4BUR4_9BACT|nr:DUF4465 domain-containing protein [Aureibacter tunicatorum]MDR6241077.1 hypothetical protein [Aureibacter tunicatorum]BDD03855.1 hypothetical protein AUTU_13380 [Aureibacter tunicatorum]